MLDQIRRDRGLDFAIEIDGGVTVENIGQVADAGTDIIVAGSAVFGAEDVAGRTLTMRKILEGQR